MELKIKIKMDNAAFEGANRNLEAAHILRDLADKFEDGADLIPGYSRRLQDENGNHVGDAKVAR